MCDFQQLGKEQFYNYLIVLSEIREILSIILHINADSSDEYISAMPAYLIGKTQISLIELAKAESMKDILLVVRHTGYYNVLKTVPCDEKGHVDYLSCEIKLRTFYYQWLTDTVKKDFPKSDAGFRTIIMSKEALNTIENIFMIRDANDEYLFSKRGKRILSKNYGWHLRGVCKELGIPFRSMHKIRKTYGTTLIDNDVDDSTVVEQMGHSDIKCTKQYYYFSNKSTAKKIEQIDKAISW